MLVVSRAESSTDSWFGKTLALLAVVCGLAVVGGAQISPPTLGLHTNHMKSWPVQVPFDLWRTLDSTYSYGSSEWAGIQTSANTYDFRLIDLAMQDAAAANVQVMFTPWVTPAFIANSHGFKLDGSGPQTCKCDPKFGTNGCNPPSDLNSDGSGADATWINFVTNLATHVHNMHVANPSTYADISYWEAGNEYLLNPAQWCGTLQQLDRMQQDMKCVITGTGPGCTNTAINPDAKTMTVAIAGKNYGHRINIAYLNALANVNPVQTPGQLADVIDFHCYMSGTDHPESIIQEVKTLQVLSSKPLYCSEGGWSGHRPPSTWQHAQDWLARFLLSISSTGIIGYDFFQYDGYLSDTQNKPFLEVLWAPSHPPNNYYCNIQASNGYFCTTEPAWTVVYGWMRNITFNNPCTSQPAQSGNIWTCDHASTGGSYSVGKFLWFDVLDNTAQYTVPAGFTWEFGIDGSSNPVTTGQVLNLTNSPILLTNGTFRP